MSSTVPALDAPRRQEEEEDEDEGEESGEHLPEVEDDEDTFKVGEKVGLQEQLELDKVICAPVCANPSVLAQGVEE